MVLTLNNIGKISDATVELNGITVIAGENNTGKSTVGKVLFCLFNSLYRIDEQIYNERKRNIKNVFNRIHVISSVGIELNRMPDSTEIVAQLLENGRDNHEINPDEISAAIRRYFERNFEKVSKSELRRSTEVIADILSLSDDVIFKEILSLALAAEFNGQINNIYLPDESGNISLKIQNKTINVSVIENGTLILDEPEIHLHPEWQKLFAELIVLIQKEFDMHILLNTHSPYFLYAIEVYSAKYKIADKCKYYLAEEIKGKSKISDVTTDIDRIYQKLSRSLQDLENERYSDSSDCF